MITLQDALNQLYSMSVSDALDILKPLIIYIVGIVIYAVFVFKFYKFLATRDVFKLNLHERSESFLGFIAVFVKTILYVLEYLILFPLFAYFWFIILAFLLLIMSSSAEVATVLLTAMAVVAAVRVTAYYNEDLSKDLAKMIPFALLGVYLIDASVLNLAGVWEKVLTVPAVLISSLFYLVVIVIIEITLRIIYLILSIFRKPQE